MSAMTRKNEFEMTSGRPAVTLSVAVNVFVMNSINRIVW
jgi:hypothetical protein